MDRVCRVIPDVLALDRSFDYLIPEHLAELVHVGTIVRIGLRGRRVRGWVEAVDVEPEGARGELRPIAKVSSVGPSAEVMALTEWAAWRWSGPRAAFLRAASPVNNVPPGGVAERRAPPRPADVPAPDAEVEELAVQARGRRRAVVRWPPGDRMAELLRRLVASEGSTIVAVPDTGRARALFAHLRRSGLEVVALHSDQTPRERTEAWDACRRGGCVIVGGRTVAWVPVPDLAAVVIVDDLDEGFKEERAPTWHARDVLVERVERERGRWTVVTPAPSLEVLAREPEVLRPSRRRERMAWGAVGIIDRRDEPPGTGMWAPELVGALRDAVSQGPVVCVLNRRGRARLLACDGCGRVVVCENCDGAVAEDEGGLSCRRCGVRRPRVCARCASTTLRRLRPGISRLREELEALVPRTAVQEVDVSAGEILSRGVLIGTEAVLHRVREAALVVFLDFDQELLAPRFRAPEQALWLLVRAVRCVGLRHDARRVLVQTRLPEHPTLRAALASEPQLLAVVEREHRSALGFPPFGALAEASGSEEEVRSLAESLTPVEGIELLGPIVSAKKAQLLVRAGDTTVLCDALREARRAGGGRRRSWPRIDVDPLRA